MINTSEKSNWSFSDAVNFLIYRSKEELNTCIPGVIKAYDARTKRAKVLPAIKQKMIKENEENTYIDHPILVDIPIIFPSAGGYTITMPIQSGDSVLLVFSQRGIANFKQAFNETIPTDQSLLSIYDAIAIPGFGEINISPASSSGCTMQDNVGDNAVIVETDKLTVKKNNNMLILDDNQFQATVGGATLTLSQGVLASSVPITAPSFSGGSGAPAKMTSGINMSGQSITDAKDVVASGKSLAGHIHDGVHGKTSGPK